MRGTWVDLTKFGDWLNVKVTHKLVILVREEGKRWKYRFEEVACCL